MENSNKNINEKKAALIKMIRDMVESTHEKTINSEEFKKRKEEEKQQWIRYCESHH